MTPKEIEALFSGEGWSISRRYPRVICFRGYGVAAAWHSTYGYHFVDDLHLYPVEQSSDERGFSLHSCVDVGELVEAIQSFLRSGQRAKHHARNERLSALSNAAMEALDDLGRYGPRPRRVCAGCLTPRERGHNYCPGCGHRHNPKRDA